MLLGYKYLIIFADYQKYTDYDKEYATIDIDCFDACLL